MLLVRPSSADPSQMEIRWDAVPTFISVNGGLQIQLANELNEEFAGKLTTSDEDLLKVHEYICTWLEGRFPMYKGLASWLDRLSEVEELVG